MNSIAAINVGRQRLGLDEDTYRLMLVRITKKDSLRAMSEEERKAVLAEMRRQGFKSVGGGRKGASKGVRRNLSGTYAKKAQALWIALWNLGAVEDNQDSALVAFFQRQTGIERPEWVLDAAEGRKVVEALKSWCAREGVDWSTGDRPEFALRYGYQIARAQHEKLRPAAREFWPEVDAVLGRVTFSIKPTDSEWIAVMNAFGKRIRAQKTASSD